MNPAAIIHRLAQLAGRVDALEAGEARVRSQRLLALLDVLEAAVAPLTARCDGTGTFVRERLGPGGPYETSEGDCPGCVACWEGRLVVVERDSHPPLAMVTCDRCFALVAEEDWDRHVGWHRTSSVAPLANEFMLGPPKPKPAERTVIYPATVMPAAPPKNPLA